MLPATLLLKRSLPRNVFLLVAAVEVEGTVPASNVMRELAMFKRAPVRPKGIKLRLIKFFETPS